MGGVGNRKNSASYTSSPSPKQCSEGEVPIPQAVVSKCYETMVIIYFLLPLVREILTLYSSTSDNVGKCNFQR